MDPSGQSHRLRLIILAGIVLLLAAWNAVDLAFDPPRVGSAPVAGEPQPAALMIGQAGQAEPGPVRHDPIAPVAGTGSASPMIEVAPSADHRSDGAYAQMLDRVFAPERLHGAAHAVPVDAATATASPAGASATSAPGAGVGSWSAPPGAIGGPSAAGTSAEAASEAKSRARSEKAWYEEFCALARRDPEEFERQATAALLSGAASPQTVAMLRAAYAQDPARSLDRFVQAMTTLPDQARPEAVSVPAFAIGFLCQRTTEPAVRALVERMAWMGYLNLPDDRRRLAQQSLIATASPAELQRYAAYPGYTAVLAETAP
jgi:hypothetical protein